MEDQNKKQLIRQKKSSEGDLVVRKMHEYIVQRSMELLRPEISSKISYMDLGGAVGIKSFTSDVEAYRVLLKFMQGVLTDITNKFRVKENMTENEIGELAEMIIDNYPDMTMEDMVIFRREALLGYVDVPPNYYLNEFGKYSRRIYLDKVYSYLDLPTILKWIQKHYEAKSIWREVAIKKEQEDRNKALAQGYINLEAVRKHYDELERKNQERIRKQELMETENNTEMTEYQRFEIAMNGHNDQEVKDMAVECYRNAKDELSCNDAEKMIRYMLNRFGDGSI